MKWKIKVNGKDEHVAAEDIMAQRLVQSMVEESWPERDKLPAGDPIGDTDDAMDAHVLDALRYMSQMQKHVLIPEGKVFGYTVDQVLEFEKYMNPEPTCNCGTFAVHGNIPASGHAHYCDLRKK
jgi:hypothetical protein